MGGKSLFDIEQMQAIKTKAWNEFEPHFERNVIVFCHESSETLVDVFERVHCMLLTRLHTTVSQKGFQYWDQNEV